MDLTVSDLVQRFDSGEIRLPLMQRDYVWKPKKVVELLDSMYHDWPRPIPTRPVASIALKSYPVPVRDQ